MLALVLCFPGIARELGRIWRVPKTNPKFEVHAKVRAAPGMHVYMCILVRVRFVCVWKGGRREVGSSIV
jgi:hypothetical protein